MRHTTFTKIGCQTVCILAARAKKKKQRNSQPGEECRTRASDLMYALEICCMRVLACVTAVSLEPGPLLLPPFPPFPPFAPLLLAPLVLPSPLSSPSSSSWRPFLPAFFANMRHAPGTPTAVRHKRWCVCTSRVSKEAIFLMCYTSQLVEVSQLLNLTLVRDSFFFMSDGNLDAALAAMQKKAQAPKRIAKAWLVSSRACYCSWVHSGLTCLLANLLFNVLVNCFFFLVPFIFLCSLLFCLLRHAHAHANAGLG